MKPVTVVDYDLEWPTWFERYRDELLDVCGDMVDTIVHVGSTAVPGLASKNVIDIMVGVGQSSMLDVSQEPLVVPGDGQNVVPSGAEPHVRLVNAIKGLGYRYRGENTVPGRLLFGHRDLTPDCHVHVALVGSEFWRDHLTFVDYLRSNPEKAAQYAALKRRLAIDHRDDRIAYGHAKTEFIRACLKSADE